MALLNNRSDNAKKKYPPERKIYSDKELTMMSAGFSGLGVYTPAPVNQNSTAAGKRPKTVRRKVFSQVT